MTIKTNSGRNSGFTLVELAIVLMIIGLLIAGILRGQELMNNARVTTTVQQVKAYQGAYHTFQDIYSAKPGDLSMALARIPGCAAAGVAVCGNGDGNSIVGQPGLANTDNINQAGIQSLPQVETSYFWKHLAMAHLISGVDPSTPVTQPDWGKTMPMAKIGGGFTVFTATGIAGDPGDKGFGVDLRLQGAPRSIGMNDFPALSPIRAFQIDKKMDDGGGDSGSVTGDHEWDCDPGGVYMMNQEAATCYMYFMFD